MEEKVENEKVVEKILYKRADVGGLSSVGTFKHNGLTEKNREDILQGKSIELPVGSNSLVTGLIPVPKEEEIELIEKVEPVESIKKKKKTKK